MSLDPHMLPPGQSPTGPAGINWERATIEKLVLANFKEQRAARRWKVFFRVLMFALLAAYLWVIYLGVQGKGLGGNKDDATAGPHTAVVDVKGAIAADKDANADAINKAMRRALKETNVKALSALATEGFTFIIITNQAGIGRGLVQADAVRSVNDFIVAHLAGAGIEVIDIYLCPHQWDAGCSCRKPKPGMLTRAAREHDLYLPKTVFVGDDARDVEAGNAAGTQTLFISEETNTDARPTLGTFADLQAALPALRKAYNTV